MMDIEKGNQNKGGVDTMDLKVKIRAEIISSYKESVTLAVLVDNKLAGIIAKNALKD